MVGPHTVAAGPDMVVAVGPDMVVDPSLAPHRQKEKFPRDLNTNLSNMEVCLLKRLKKKKDRISGGYFDLFIGIV